METPVKFRHKCPPEVNPKWEDGVVRDDYAAHIRREYEVPADAEWLPIMTGDPALARMGAQEPSGRVMAVVECPDCGAEVVVTTEA